MSYARTALLALGVLGLGFVDGQGTPKAPIERIIRAKQLDRYSVTVKSDVGEQVQQSEYVLLIFAPKRIETDSVPLTIRLERLKVSVAGKTMKEPKVGQVQMHADKSGFLKGMSLGTEADLYLLPLLVWALPDSIASDGSFSMATETMGGISVDGAGKLTKGDRTSEIVLDLRVGSSSAKPSFHSKTKLQTADGRVLESQISVHEGDRDIEYTLKRF